MAHFSPLPLREMNGEEMTLEAVLSEICSLLNPTLQRNSENLRTEAYSYNTNSAI
jgi:hypothetical protein